MTSNWIGDHYVMNTSLKSSAVTWQRWVGIGALTVASATALHLPQVHAADASAPPPVGPPGLVSPAETQSGTAGAAPRSTQGRRMSGGLIFVFAISLIGCLGSVQAAAGYSWICREPGGKRLVRIDNTEIGMESDHKTLLTIDPNNFILDRAGKRLFIVDDNDVRPGATPGGVRLAIFDGDDIRHGGVASGKVLINYRHPDLAPTSAGNRIYSIEGPALSKAQLVAGLYLLKPEMFRLTDEETAAQLAEFKKNAAEQHQRDIADQVAGKWTMLNSSGIREDVGKGLITAKAKKGEAYPMTFDFSPDGGPQWSGVGVYKYTNGDKLFWTAYGTPKTVGLCVYEIKDGGVLEGKWYPWYVDGDPKNVGTENLKGPGTLDGEFTIVSAKAPNTGAAYGGTVTIKPQTIVGTSDNAKPYLITWKLGTLVIRGIGIRSDNFLYVASGSGADVNVARFNIGNGTMNSEWFKLGSDEMGRSAAMSGE